MRVVRAWSAAAVSGFAVAICALVGAGGAAAAPASCAPGSGLDLHAKRLTTPYLQRRPDLRCANLTGSDLSGLSLVQLDLGRAVLRDANLTGTDLTQADLTEADLTSAHLSHAHLIQATLTDAVFRGADLSNADLGQADAQRADFAGADLSGADLTQAHLENAHLDSADVGGLKTTQAYLHGTSFSNARGVRPWDRYLLIGCAALYVLLVIGAVSTHLRRGTRSKLPQAILGRMIMVIGVHLFVGFVIGKIASATGPPIDQTCHGVQCSLGVAAAAWAPFVGFLLIFVGALVSGTARGRRPTTVPVLGGAFPAQLAALGRVRFGPTFPASVPPPVTSTAPFSPPPYSPAAASALPLSPPADPPPPFSPPVPPPPFSPPAVPPPPVPIPATPFSPLPEPYAPPVAAFSPAPPLAGPPTRTAGVPATAGGRVLTAEQSLLPPEVLQLALAGNKRAAARKYRESTGASRWEAKSVLEGL